MKYRKSVKPIVKKGGELLIIKFVKYVLRGVNNVFKVWSITKANVFYFVLEILLKFIKVFVKNNSRKMAP